MENICLTNLAMDLMLSVDKKLSMLKYLFTTLSSIISDKHILVCLNVQATLSLSLIQEELTQQDLITCLIAIVPTVNLLHMLISPHPFKHNQDGSVVAVLFCVQARIIILFMIILELSYQQKASYLPITAGSVIILQNVLRLAKSMVIIVLMKILVFQNIKALLLIIIVELCGLSP